MDKNLIILILFVAVMLASLIAVIVWLAWPTIREIRLSNRRHRQYQIQQSKTPTLGTQIRSTEVDHSPSFGNW